MYTTAEQKGPTVHKILFVRLTLASQEEIPGQPSHICILASVMERVYVHPCPLEERPCCLHADIRPSATLCVICNVDQLIYESLVRQNAGMAGILE